MIELHIPLNHFPNLQLKEVIIIITIIIIIIGATIHPIVIIHLIVIIQLIIGIQTLEIICIIKTIIIIAEVIIITTTSKKHLLVQVGVVYIIIKIIHNNNILLQQILTIILVKEIYMVMEAKIQHLNFLLIFMEIKLTIFINRKILIYMEIIILSKQMLPIHKFLPSKIIPITSSNKPHNKIINILQIAKIITTNKTKIHQITLINNKTLILKINQKI